MEILGNKYLTFLLNNEIYGIPIKKVKEIIGILEFTPIPRVKSYIKGVMNLRGKIMPVIDLRLKFGLEGKAYNERTSIIVIEVILNGVMRLIGIIVDIVSEVVNIQQAEIEPISGYGTEIEGNFILGIGKLKERVILILDVEKVLNTDEIAFIKKEVAVSQEEQS